MYELCKLVILQKKYFLVQVVCVFLYFCVVIKFQVFLLEGLGRDVRTERAKECFVDCVIGSKNVWRLAREKARRPRVSFSEPVHQQIRLKNVSMDPAELGKWFPF